MFGKGCSMLAFLTFSFRQLLLAIVSKNTRSVHRPLVILRGWYHLLPSHGSFRRADGGAWRPAGVCVGAGGAARLAASCLPDPAAEPSAVLREGGGWAKPVA